MLNRRDQDVGFWMEQALAVDGPVLELACGTGRLTVPMAAAGVPIVGLDNDPAMVAGAACGPVFLVGDMRRFALARRFRLIFVGYNSLQLLTGRADMVRCLDCARHHLAPGGVIGVEVTDFQRDGADGADGDDLVPLAEADGIRLSGSLVHDLGGRRSHYRRRFEGEGWSIEDEVVVRSLNRPELERLFQEAGLVPVRWWSEGATVRAVATVPAP